MTSRLVAARLLVAGVAACLVALPDGAQAADVAYPAKAPVAGPSWTGFYGGLQVGARWNDNQWTTSSVCPAVAFCATNGPGPDARQSFNDVAARIGAYTGYNWQVMPRVVFGVEADFGWAKNKSSRAAIPGTTTIGGFTSNTTLDSSSISSSWDASARVRLGALAAPDVLLYVTGGAVMQQYDFNASCANPGGLGYCSVSTPHNETVSQTRIGWTVGGGIEKMISRWVFRLEYRYADLGTFNHTFFASNFGGGLDDRVTANFKLRSHLMNVGLAYLF